MDMFGGGGGGGFAIGSHDEEEDDAAEAPAELPPAPAVADAGAVLSFDAFSIREDTVTFN
jgi:hypothetical protein